MELLLTRFYKKKLNYTTIKFVLKDKDIKILSIAKNRKCLKRAFERLTLFA